MASDGEGGTRLRSAHVQGRRGPGWEEAGGRAVKRAVGLDAPRRAGRADPRGYFRPTCAIR